MILKSLFRMITDTKFENMVSITTHAPIALVFATHHLLSIQTVKFSKCCQIHKHINIKIKKFKV